MKSVWVLTDEQLLTLNEKYCLMHIFLWMVVIFDSSFLGNHCITGICMIYSCMYRQSLLIIIDLIVWKFGICMILKNGAPYYIHVHVLLKCKLVFLFNYFYTLYIHSMLQTIWADIFNCWKLKVFWHL